jgi:hypothetical protein
MNLVQKMGGELAIVDKDSPGCLFHFDLTFHMKLRTSAVFESRRRQSPPFPPAISADYRPRFSAVNMVLAKKQLITRSAAAQTLRKLGAMVVEAMSWDEALAAVQALVHDHYLRTPLSESCVEPRPVDGVPKVLNLRQLGMLESSSGSSDSANVKQVMQPILFKPGLSRHTGVDPEMLAELLPASFELDCAFLELLLIPGAEDRKSLQQELHKLNTIDRGMYRNPEATCL